MPGLRFSRVDTSIGPMWIAETSLGIAAASRSDAVQPFLDGLRRRFPRLAPEPGSVDGEWVESVIATGSLPPVDLRGLSTFDAGVYETVRAVPVGETITYGEVAALVGSPGGGRAVGGAMARCPLFPAVPCHRVVRAADGWSGWGGDVSLKRRLLRGELTPLSAEAPVPPDEPLALSGTNHPRLSHDCTPFRAGLPDTPRSDRPLEDSETASEATHADAGW